MTVEIINADCLTALGQMEDESFDCILTDPPYGETSLRWDRWPTGWPGSVRRLLKRTGSMWVFGSQRMFLSNASEFDGWKLSHDVVWEKHNGTGLFNDRFRRVHELALHFYRDDAKWAEVYKSPQFTQDARARTVRKKGRPAQWIGATCETIYRSEEGGPRLMRSVQFVRSEYGNADHSTQKPIGIVEPLLLYACPPGGRVLDLFAGSGTTGLVARRHGMNAVLIEADEQFVKVIRSRLDNDAPLFAGERGMNPHALSGTARLPGCDVEVSASQAGSRRTSKSTFTGTPEQSPCRGQPHALIRKAIISTVMPRPSFELSMRPPATVPPILPRGWRLNALHLDNWTVKAVQHGSGGYRIRAAYDVAPPHCPSCGSLRPAHRHEKHTIEYVDAPLYRLRNTIEVETARYACQDCGATFMQPLPDMYPNRKLTRRCVEFIETQTGNQTWAATAEQIGIDEKTVREIGHAQVARVSASVKPYAPRILGIDELKLSGQLRVMLVDIDRKQPIDTLDTFSKAPVVHWLLNLPQRGLIKLVAMDMSSMFHSAVQAALPGIPIVADKFHVVRAASGALHSIRIAKGKAAETKTRKKATYRGRQILLKRPSNLTAKQAFALDGMLANDADLREAYEAKERFFQIWDAPDRGSAEMGIDEWMETVPPQHRAAFKHAITALEDWREEVLTYWEEVLTYWGEFPEISNAYTEAANGMAKIHNRKGRGYKFEVIRARVLIDMRTVTPTDFVKCHGCGIGFAAGRLVAQEAVSIGRGRRKVHLMLCPNCMVRNLEWDDEAQASTHPQSE